MKFQLFLITGLGFLNIHFCLAQKVWKCWDDSSRVKSNHYALLNDHEMNKNWQEAEPHLMWFLKYAPDLNKVLYQKGVNVLQGLIDITEDQEKKQAYQDLLLDLHDRRIQYFGEEAYVLNRKGYYALSYWANRPEKYMELYQLYKKIVELNKEDTYGQNMKNYVHVINYLHKSKQKEFTEEKLITIYEELSGYVEINLAKATNDASKKTWKAVQDFLDGRFSIGMPVDCDFIKSRLIPKIDKVPEEERLALINSVLSKMVQQKCTDDPQFLELSKRLFDEDPNYISTLFLFRASLFKSDFENAQYYIKKAFELANTDLQKIQVVEMQAGLCIKLFFLFNPHLF